MSDQVLKLIPADKNFIPYRDAAEKARVLMESFFPDGEQAEVAFSEVVKFIDGGQNLERIKCPVCNMVTEMDPFKENDAGMTWWYELNDTLATHPDTDDLSIRMPCCHEQVLLQSIDFYGAVGFSKFELCIWNPNTGSGVNASQLEILENLLGCRLQQIWAHY